MYPRGGSPDQGARRGRLQRRGSVQLEERMCWKSGHKQRTTDQEVIITASLFQSLHQSRANISKPRRLSKAENHLRENWPKGGPGRKKKLENSHLSAVIGIRPKMLLPISKQVLRGNTTHVGFIGSCKNGLDDHLCHSWHTFLHAAAAAAAAGSVREANAPWSHRTDELSGLFTT